MSAGGIVAIDLFMAFTEAQMRLGQMMRQAELEGRTLSRKELAILATERRDALQSLLDTE